MIAVLITLLITILPFSDAEPDSVIQISADKNINNMGIGLEVPSDIYIISIGVDKYTFGPKNTEVKLQYAESDARTIAALAKESFLATETKDARGQTILRKGRIIETVLTGEEVTNENIRSAFQQVVDSSGTEDYFLFYFGGYNTYKETDQGRSHYLIGHNDTFENMYEPDKYDQENFFPIRKLHGFLENMEAKNQAIILEASDTKQVSDELVSIIADTNPLSMIMKQKNRLIISPKGHGMEGPEYESGLLAKYITELKDNKTHKSRLFDYSYRSHWQDRLQHKLFEIEDSLDLYDGNYLEIFNERDVVRYLSLFKNQFSSQSRGVGTVESIQTAKDKEAGMSRHALLIGINEYYSETWPDLKNPVYDIDAVEKELSSSYGFQTDKLLNPTKKEILTKLLYYFEKIKYSENSQLFVFIAGHGGFDNFTNGFIAAKDSKRKSEDPGRSSYIKHSELRDMLNNIPSKQLFVVLDVCYGGTFDQRISEASFRSEQQDDPLYQNIALNDFIERKLEYGSRLYMTSGGKERVPEGRPGQHSPFASRFLEALRSNGGPDGGGILTFAEIKQYVAKLTPEPRAGTFGNSEPGGDFIFINQN
ncbi:MAG: caspase family protein [Balneolaceae bacterium]|nr:caspase family protein [Balneolaceae bacterium]